MACPGVGEGFPFVSALQKEHLIQCPEVANVDITYLSFYSLRSGAPTSDNPDT